MSNNLPTIIGPATLPQPLRAQDIEDDSFTRDKVINAIEQGAHAVAHLTELALQSQDAEHYDSLAKLLKVVIEGNESLLRIRQMREKLASQNNDEEGSSKTINNLFVGSTAELQDLIEKAREGKANN